MVNVRIEQHTYKRTSASAVTNKIDNFSALLTQVAVIH